MKTIERTHIIPLGFERDVAVKPIRELGGSRAILITIGGEVEEKYELSEEQRHFEKVVEEDLEKLGLEVKIEHADLFDFNEAVRAIASAVVREKEEGREVYINLSSHGRLISIISALVGWYHDVAMYYVLADRYARDEEEFKQRGRSVCEKPVILRVPQVDVVRLSEEERFALSEILSGTTKLDELVKKFCERFPLIYECKLDERGGWDRKNKQEVLTKLNRRVLLKLESKGFIRREKTGRNVFLNLTDRGEIFALLEGG
ncbi:MAG: hypothetical protein XD48_0080 [Archaeoglobus fulgidus]|jgi:hypothetical protein|uniref:Uncharacterized protein n=1 Tax=Archaeoglobus fulgidus TaxID=2234 RepID=A0A101E263_ARCFL|nr:MAG: hypothetical protein XD48_0080 [Archaeoglobus fulgidus]